MKILHVIPSMSASYGGPSFFLSLLEPLLEQKGAEIKIAATYEPKEGLCSNSKNMILFARQYPKTYFYSYSLGKWLSEEVRHFDVIHVHSIFTYPSIAACHYARKHKKPYIIRPFGMLDKESMNYHRVRKLIHFNLIDRANLNHAGLIHCTSESELNDIKRFHLSVRENVIPHGLIPEDYANHNSDIKIRYGIPKDTKTILFLSRIHSRKGLEFLFQALSLLKKIRMDFALLIAGNGETSYVANLKKKAHEALLDSHIYWIKEVQGIEKKDLLSGVDLFVLPSYRESFGLVVVEAMAAGCPVIISDKVAIQREIKLANAGKVIPLNESEWAKAIEGFLKDSDLRKQISKNAKRLVKEKYNLRTSAEQLSNIYKELIK